MTNLPAKTKILKRASVFNKTIKTEAFEYFKKEKNYLNNRIKEDIKENIFFRNYEDYLISIYLEEKENFQRFQPISLQKAFTSKMLLEIFKENLNSVPLSKRTKKVGVFDTETTDIAGYIVSYAFVVYNLETQEIETEIHEKINPQTKIHEEAYQVHKISQEEVANKPTFGEKKEEILSMFENVDLLVGHNILYDLGVLKRELERDNHQTNLIDISIFDTMYYSVDVVELDKKKLPRLEECVRYFFGPQNAAYHDALEDVKMTLKVFQKLIEL